jgi:hypothetical protein
MQRKIHLSLMAWFSILLIALVLSPSFPATQSPPVSDYAFAQAGTSTEKEGADLFAEVALSTTAYFRSDLDVFTSGLTNANIPKTKSRSFVGGLPVPGSLNAFMVNFDNCGDHTVGSVLAAIPFTPPSDFSARAEVFAGEGE